MSQYVGRQQESATAARETADAAANGERFVRKNYILGIVNGALGRLGMGFMDPNLVLGAFIYERTQSEALNGLIGTLVAFGVLWPQLVTSRIIEHRPRKKPYYIALTIVRLLSMATMAIAVWLSGTSGGTAMLVLFFASLFVFQTALGGATLPFLDIIGQTIVATRIGRFFGWRAALGDALTLAAGYLVMQPILRNVEPPNNFAALIAVAVVICSAAWITFWFSHEDRNENPPRERSLWETISEAAADLKTDKNYRKLMVLRMLFRVNTLGVIFYVPYGVDRLGAVGISGVLLSFISASRMLSSYFWGKMSDARGTRACLVGGALFFVLSPLGVLLAPRLPGGFSYNLPYTDVQLDLPLAVYLLALFLFGLAMQATITGTNAILIEMAPPDRRPSYIAFLNTIALPLCVLPLAVGLLVSSGVFSLDILFAGIAVAGGYTLLTALQLREIRTG